MLKKERKNRIFFSPQVPGCLTVLVLYSQRFRQESSALNGPDRGGWERSASSLFGPLKLELRGGGGVVHKSPTHSNFAFCLYVEF